VTLSDMKQQAPKSMHINFHLYLFRNRFTCKSCLYSNMQVAL